MPRQEYDEALQGVLKRLEASRTRLVLQRILQDVLWTALAATGVFLSLELLRYLAPVLPWFSSVPASVAGIVALTVLALGLLWTLISVWLATPNLLMMGQQADRRFELDERLGTALEFGKAEQARVPSPVLEALVRDVDSHAKRVRPAELIAIAMPRQVWYLVVVAVAALALQLAPPLSSPVTAVTSAAPAMTAEQLAETVASVQRVAALVGQDAEQRDDPYLQAVARALEKLGADIEQERLGGEEVEEELARLVEHLARGYGLEAQVASEVAAMLSTDGPSEDAALSPAESEGEQMQMDEAVRVEVERNAADSRTALENLVAHLEAEGAEGQQASGATPSASAEETQAGRQSYDYTNIDPEMLARLEREREIRAQLRAESPVGGNPVGDGDGTSNEAGAGTQPLFDEDGNELSPEWAGAAEEFELPFDQESSRRIRVEMAPEAQFTAVSGTQGIDGAGWRRLGESPISDDFLGVVNRQIASRYFLSIHREPETEAGP